MLGGPTLTALTTNFNTNVANFGTAYRRYQPLLAIQKGTRCQPTPLARAHLQWPCWRPEELEDKRVLAFSETIATECTPLRELTLVLSVLLDEIA